MPDASRAFPTLRVVALPFNFRIYTNTIIPLVNPGQLNKEQGEAKMLILTRRPGESIKIDEEIELVILGVTGNQVRVGIDAPIEMVVLRSELLDNEQDVAA